MSSWDRARYIPWTRISQVSADEYERDKEAVYKSLNWEASQENKQKEQLVKGEGFVPPEIKEKKGFFDSKVPFTTPDLLRSVAFGATIGSISGAMFGFMDGIRTAQESSVLKKASNETKGKFIFQGTGRSSVVFGAFFSGYHTLRYGIRVACDPGVVWEMFGAGTISLSTLFFRPQLRPFLPYGGILIGMDAFSTYMKEEL